MTSIELKSNFHKLIDNIHNDTVLIKFYELMNNVKETKKGSLWSRLSFEEQQELLLIEKESHNLEKLISQNEMLNKHKKWL